ncbi:SDR family oxidoreductase [Prochlorococcus marinus]|uniref:Dehydrogenase with different specificities n=1 Tax=Prochlorococcus marinus (strain MIT 9211) TaxID=93059 RepID=A9BE99_PROM4|nr:SDR family oxidoreductase [Prochlorococcus marinus]ABX08409.1 Dehydrogenase with different specificities [Prochlorococcus marinus str. MIT 9211]
MINESQDSSSNKTHPINPWANRRIGITGARGSLGIALTKKFRSQGAFVIGLSHRSISHQKNSITSPNEWVQWECGQEVKLDKVLASLDILILNHGINPGGSCESKDINESLEINALSSWRLFQRFENICLNNNHSSKKNEIWINTSEAEIQPALSPVYEITKRLIGQLVSLKGSSITKTQRSNLRIRKLILGPFRSELNPLGLMSPDWVAGQIINQASLSLNLIIVTPNPVTYFLVPLNEFFRAMYFNLFKNKGDIN